MFSRNVKKKQKLDICFYTTELSIFQAFCSGIRGVYKNVFGQICQFLLKQNGNEKLGPGNMKVTPCAVQEGFYIITAHLILIWRRGNNDTKTLC